MQTILFGERVKKTTDNRFGWRTLYNGNEQNPRLLDDTLLGEKSIIFFPGDGTKSEREANGYCKSAEGMLKRGGLSEKNMPHIYGLAYLTGKKYLEQHRYQLLTQMGKTQFGRDVEKKNDDEPSYYQPFFDMYILPLLVGEDGKPRSLPEIRKNIQNLTFISHCHGGFMACQIEKMMAEKLSDFYPKQMPELMSNLRMLHLSSRRPKGQTFAKHLDIMVQNDAMYADGGLLEYDDIHKQVRRMSLSENSALISTSPNEELLIFKEIVPETEARGTIGQDPNHGDILSIFSGDKKNSVFGNEEGIHFVCQALRHFVEHPEDQQDVHSQLEKINPVFVKENEKRGKKLFSDEKENEKIRRGLLSLISTWGAHLGYRRSSDFQEDEQRKFLERDDEGHFLYDELKKNYQQMGNSRSLINFIKMVGIDCIPKKERGNLAVLAVQNHDWALAAHLNYVTQSQFKQIVEMISPDDLYHVLPIFKGVASNLSRAPKLFDLLLHKMMDVKNFEQQKQIASFLERYTQLQPDSPNLKIVLKRLSVKRKKSLKSLLSESRQKRATELFDIMRERNDKAADLTIKEMEEAKICHLSLDRYREYKKQKKDDPKLSVSQFIRDSRQAGG